MDALKGVGFAESHGFGTQPVSWANLAAYGLATRALESRWDYETVFGMSRAYCEGLRLGENVWAKFPWHEDDD